MFRYLAERGVTLLVGRISGLFLSIGSNFSIASLLCALCIAITFVLLSRRPGKKDVKYKIMRRALFPRWLCRASFRADVGFLLFNVFAFAMLFGWAVITSQFVSAAVASALADRFGVRPKPALNDFTSRLIVTVCLF